MGTRTTAHESHRRLLADMIRLRVSETLDDGNDLSGFGSALAAPRARCLGEEAVTVGVLGAVRDDDVVLTTHHRHRFGCRGVTPDEVHRLAIEKPVAVSRPVVPAALPGRVHGPFGARLTLAHAAGIASVASTCGDTVTVCFVGGTLMDRDEFRVLCDVASEQRMALLLCGHRDPHDRGVHRHGRERAHGSGSGGLAEEAVFHGIPAWTANGMDVLEVRRAARRALAVVRAGGGPLFVEFTTSRVWVRPPLRAPFVDTSGRTTPATRDPIRELADRLVAAGELTEEEVDDLWRAAATGR